MGHVPGSDVAGPSESWAWPWLNVPILFQVSFPLTHCDFSGWEGGG